MKLSSLSQNVVMVPYKHGEETLELQVNIDGFTPEFWRAMKTKAEERFKAAQAKEPKGKAKKKLTDVEQELENIEWRARRLELERESTIEFLIPYILKGWDLTDDDGNSLALTAEILTSLPPQTVEVIFQLCVKAAKTVKKRVDEEDEETLENSPSGSRAPLALAPTG